MFGCFNVKVLSGELRAEGGGVWLCRCPRSLLSEFLLEILSGFHHSLVQIYVVHNSHLKLGPTNYLKKTPLFYLPY